MVMYLDAAGSVSLSHVAAASVYRANNPQLGGGCLQSGTDARRGCGGDGDPGDVASLGPCQLGTAGDAGAAAQLELYPSPPPSDSSCIATMADKPATSIAALRRDEINHVATGGTCAFLPVSIHLVRSAVRRGTGAVAMLSRLEPAEIRITAGGYTSQAL
eukprot:366559-Chlamydomonas_euryale.AAC.20